MKILFTIINALFTIGALKFLLLTFKDDNLMSLVLPSFFLLLFICNIVSIWKIFPVWVSIIQIFLTLLSIAIIKVIYAFAKPFAIGIAQAMSLVIDNDLLARLDLSVNIVAISIAVSAIYIAYQAYLVKKNKKQL